MFITLVAIFSFLFAVPAALAEPIKPAAIPCVPGLPCVQPATQEDSKAVREHVFGTFGGKFLKYTLGLVAAASAIFIVIGGIQMHLALGNEEALTKAKKTLIWAIAGLVISILSVAIVQIVSNLQLGGGSAVTSQNASGSAPASNSASQ